MTVKAPHDYLGAVKIGKLVDNDSSPITYSFDVFVVADDMTSLPIAMYTNKGFKCDTLAMKNLYTILDSDMYTGKIAAYSTADVGGDEYSSIATKANPFIFALEVSPDRLNIAYETLDVQLNDGNSSWVGELAIVLTKSQLDNFTKTGTLPPVYSGSIYETGSDISKKLDLSQLKNLLNGKVVSISMSKTTLTLTKGKTAPLKATISPTNAKVKAVTWTTSNAKVATVDKNGLVKAVGKGKATITATTTDGTQLKSVCTVTVK